MTISLELWRDILHVTMYLFHCPYKGKREKYERKGGRKIIKKGKNDFWIWIIFGLLDFWTQNEMRTENSYFEKRCNVVPPIEFVSLYRNISVISPPPLPPLLTPGYKSPAYNPPQNEIVYRPGQH